MRSRALAILIVLSSFGMAEAKPTDYKLATTRTSVLGDHLSLTLGAGMKIEPRGHSIMAADASNEDETRGVLDNGTMRLVMMAYELYAKPTADFKAAVAADLKAQGEPLASAKLEPLKLPAPLSGIAVTPVPSGKDDANLIYMVYVASGDHSVQLLSFYVNPDGISDLAGFMALVHQIAASAIAGKRQLAFAAKDHEFRGAGTDKLVITAPDGFVSTTQDGPDFSVHRLREVGDLGSASRSCGIYLGGHPSYQHKQAGIADANVKSVAGKLLGTAATWHSWSDGSRFTIEAIVPHPLQASLVVHTFCTATTEAALDSLRKIAETLRVKP